MRFLQVGKRTLTRHVVHLGAEGGIKLKQALETLRVDHQELGLAQRLDRSIAEPITEQCHLAESFALAQCGNDMAVRIRQQHLALGDDVECITGLARLEDGLTTVAAAKESGVDDGFEFCGAAVAEQRRAREGHDLLIRRDAAVLGVEQHVRQADGGSLGFEEHRGRVIERGSNAEAHRHIEPRGADAEAVLHQCFRPLEGEFDRKRGDEGASGESEDGRQNLFRDRVIETEIGPHENRDGGEKADKADGHELKSQGQSCVQKVTMNELCPH